MTKPMQFLTYLHDMTNARRMTGADLAREMELNPQVVEEWFNGWRMPSANQLPALATALDADPIDVALGWMIDQAPEFEVALYDGVLAPRGTKFSHSSDLSLRGPKRRPALVSMDVDDPHDKEATPTVTRLPDEGRPVRKRRRAR